MNAARNDLTHCLIGMAIDVHRELGPGLLESAYEECLAYETEAIFVELRSAKSGTNQV